MSNVERIDPPTLVEPRGYSHIAVATGTRTVYVGGQVGNDTSGAIAAKGDYAAQTEQALTNMRLALEAAGAEPRDIVKLNLYIVRYEPEVMRDITRGFKAAGKEGIWSSVPMVLLGVGSLSDPDALIEVDAIAVTS